MFGLLTTGQGRERAQHTAKGEHEMREADGPRGWQSTRKARQGVGRGAPRQCTPCPHVLEVQQH